MTNKQIEIFLRLADNLNSYHADAGRIRCGSISTVFSPSDGRLPYYSFKHPFEGAVCHRLLCYVA